MIQGLKHPRSEAIEGYFAVKYAEFAKETPAIREAYSSLAQRVATTFSEGTLLEVGPGPAFVSIEIARRIPRAQVVGLDISETMLGIGRRNVAEAGFSGQITFRPGDTATMPFGDGEFDFVVSSAAYLNPYLCLLPEPSGTGVLLDTSGRARSRGFVGRLCHRSWIASGTSNMD